MAGSKSAPRKARANPVHALKLPDQRRLDPAIKALFATCVEKLGFVPNVLRSFTLRPSKLELFRKYN
ncbi:MAG: alkylhydroperoxidase, partial [Alphaproteobacteria bacterium]|nr:alkylhydroperoxidase [Alphaproteobacteria bacterium]